MKSCSILLFTTASLLFAIGLLMVFNTTSAEVLDRSMSVSTHSALLKQILYGAIGAVLGFGFYILGYKRLIEFSPVFLILTTFLLVLVFVPGIGQEINGARRWISIAGFSFQPSEFAKYMIPIYFIHWRLKQKEISLFSFCKIMAILCMPLGLILLEPDNGTTAMILVTLVVLFLLTRVRWVYWAVPLMIVVGGGIGAASQMPHVSDRIRVYLNPEQDLMGKGHQPYQAKIAAGSGGVWGKGLGKSMQKLNYLPAARSDYIAAIFAEEFGFAGMVVLISTYLTLALTGFTIAFRARDREGFYLASFLTFLIAFQSFLNLGVASSLLPSKGTTLPFFSHGGSSLLVNLIALFLIFNIAKSARTKFA